MSTKSQPYPFTEKEAHYRTLTTAALEWSAKDAAEARDSMAGFDPQAEGWYADDLATILKVLGERREPSPRPGMEFYHARVLTPDRSGPAAYRVTRVALGVVYYRPVDGGAPAWATVADFWAKVVMGGPPASKADPK